VGFGTIPFGIGAFGASFTFSIAAAYAINTHGIRVQFSDEPAHADAFAVGDATNPLTWAVSNLTTGSPMTIAVVAVVDETTFDLTLLETLGDDLETFQVVATGLVDVIGSQLPTPLQATLSGLTDTVDPVDVARVDFRDRDLANPIAQSSRGLGVGGTLVIGDDGDFEVESGGRLLKKLVLRRLNTVKSSFRHLPGYGCATLEKEPIATGGDLVSYLADVERQAKQEPDALEARAQGSIDRNGILIVQLSVTMSGGATVSMRMGNRGGQIVEV